MRQALAYELQAPLYFALLNLWRIPSESIFHARLFSVACTVLMLILVVGITRRYLPKLHPAWIVAVLAVHPFTIWAATEIRVYALVTLLSAVLIRLFFDGFLAATPQNRVRWGYYVVALLSLYTYYFLGFLLLAQGCALLVQRRADLRWGNAHCWRRYRTLAGADPQPSDWVQGWRASSAKFEYGIADAFLAVAGTHAPG